MGFGCGSQPCDEISRQQGASQLLLGVPVARHTRLKVDLAGSHGTAGDAAAGETDFNIQRNGAAIALVPRDPL